MLSKKSFQAQFLFYASPLSDVKKKRKQHNGIMIIPMN